MITKHEREELRTYIVKAANYEDSAPAYVFGAGSRFSLHDVSRLLDDLENAEEDIEHLRALVGKLYKIVNLASLTNCNHRCFTKETQNHLLALLEESRAVAERGKVS